MNKRFHAFLLTALMVISLVPSAIFAVDITTISDLATLKAFRDSVNAGNTYSGAAVTLYPKAAEGFVLDTIEVLDAEGNAVALDGLKFAIPAGGVTVNATFKAAQ